MYLSNLIVYSGCSLQQDKRNLPGRALGVVDRSFIQGIDKPYFQALFKWLGHILAWSMLLTL